MIVGQYVIGENQTRNHNECDDLYSTTEAEMCVAEALNQQTLFTQGWPGVEFDKNGPNVPFLATTLQVEN